MSFVEKIKGFFGQENNKEKHLSKFVPPEPISNEEYLAIRQAEEDRLEAAYDLNSLQGINSIPLSAVENLINGHSPTGKLEYYLLFKAHAYEEKGKYELAIACLRKSNELMQASSGGYEKRSYMKLVQLLRKLRRFEDARQEEAKIDKIFEHGGRWDVSSDLEYSYLPMILEQAQLMGTDLIEVSSNHGCTCGECAKYQGRWLSLSGRSEKFPKVPDSFFEHGGKFHDGCRHYVSPVFDGISSPAYYEGDIVKYSNRPFVDDRTPEEKAQYEKMIAEWSEKARADKIREADRKDYEWIWEHMEHLCPKSFGGYRRMKKSNSQNFQKLCEEALKLGRDLSL